MAFEDVITWDDWPEESFDDPLCKCYSVDNHYYCPVHGGLDMGEALQRYKDNHPEKYPRQRTFGFLPLSSLRRG